jgi:ketosteroid isomerase-like protein
MADLYTDHGMLLPKGSDFVQGKRTIQDFWQAVMDSGITEAKLEG